MPIFGIFGQRGQEKKRAQELAEQKRIQEIEERKQKAQAEYLANQRINKKEHEIQMALAKYPEAKALRLEKNQTEVNGKILSEKEFLSSANNCYVAVDTETTGLSDGDDAIVEIGAVRVRNGIIVDKFSQLIDPERPMPIEAQTVNHISDQMLKGQPKIHEVLPAFLLFVGDDIIVGHNISFDYRFLAQACMRNRFMMPKRFFDTMSLATHWPRAKNKKLETLAKEASVFNEDAHRALSDAITVVRLIQATLVQIEKEKEEKKKEKEREKEQRKEAAEKYVLQDNDRMLYSARCSISLIRNFGNFDQGYKMGSPSYYVAEELRKVGRLEDAIIMLNKARALGYDAPALYESYTTIYRKMKDYKNELDMIDEFLGRNTYGKSQKFEERRIRVIELMSQ